jgi:hypothetical protein
VPYDDDDDDWPEPEHDPEILEQSRRRMAAIREQRQRILRWTYAGLAVLIVVIVLLATLR